MSASTSPLLRAMRISVLADDDQQFLGRGAEELVLFGRRIRAFSASSPYVAVVPSRISEKAACARGDAAFNRLAP